MRLGKIMATKIKSAFLISLFILLFSFSFNALAIVSLENIYLTEPKPGYSGYITLNVDGTLENEDRRTYQLDNRIQHVQGKNLHFLRVNKTSQNQAFLHLRNIQKIWPVTAQEFFSQVEKLVT